MSDSRPRAVKPCLLVDISTGDKSRRRHLLRIQPEADGPGAVLAPRNGTRNGLGLKAVVEARLILVGIIGTGREGRNSPVLLGRCPMKDVLEVFVRHDVFDLFFSRKRVVGAIY